MGGLTEPRCWVSVDGMHVQVGDLTVVIPLTVARCLWEALSKCLQLDAASDDE